MSKHILAIETSCDDTSIALYKDKELLSIADASSMKEYGKYGGIIPELAARNHEEYINRVFNDCIKKAKIKTDMITHIAYTSEPGLPGSLHVGKVFAKTLSFLLNKPLIPINHMMGHAFSYAIDNPKLIKFPLLSLVISGGNTILYKFDSLTKYEIINETNDDAVGECLDKIGRALGLPYPGGISLDKTYKYSRNIKTIPHQDFKKPFSFSGIKSFATNYVNTSKLKKQKLEPTKIGSACLKWCIDDIITKLVGYSKEFNIDNIAIGGGVAANQLLKNEIKKLKRKHIYITERKYCGDNAAMIGFYAALTIND